MPPKPKQVRVARHGTPTRSRSRSGSRTPSQKRKQKEKREKQRKVKAGASWARQEFQNANGHKMRLAECIAFPMDKPLRFPDGEPRRTAVLSNRMSMEFKALVNGGYGTVAWTSPGPFSTPTGSFAVVLVGLPGLSYFISYDSVRLRPAVGDIPCYTMEFYTNPVNTPSREMSIETSTAAQSGALLDGSLVYGDTMTTWPVTRMPISTINYGSGDRPMGSEAPIGYHGDDTFFFMNDGDQVLIRVSTVTTNSAPGNEITLSMRMGLRRWDRGELELVSAREEQIFKTSVANTSLARTRYVVFTAKSKGWHNLFHDYIALTGLSTAINDANLTFATFNVAVNLYFKSLMVDELNNGANATLAAYFDRSTNPPAVTNKFGPQWCPVSSTLHNPATGGDRTIGALCRNNGASVLITNVTPQATRGGVIHAGRLQSARGYFWDLGLDSMTGGPDYKPMSAEFGAYSFVLPTGDRKRFEEANWSPAGGSVMFNLETFDRAWFHVAVVVASVGLDSITVTPNSYQITYDETVEFIHNTRRYENGVASIKIQEMTDAIATFQRGPQHFWYENPSHVTRIYTFLSNAFKRIAPMLDTMAPAISAAFPASAPLLGGYRAYRSFGR